MADTLDEAFATTTKLLFSRALAPMEKYGKWLAQRVPGGQRVKSALGSGTAYLPDYGYFRRMPKGKIVSVEDSARASAPILQNVEGISLKGMREAVERSAYFVPTYSQGANMGIEDTFGCIDCINVRHMFDPFTSKNCAYGLSIMDGEGSFGLHRCRAPKFSMHCYNAWDMSRCFEMDAARSCTDSMFCHNVEGLDNCLFCFNVKSKRYAIGNVELPRDRYLVAKSRLVWEIAERLEKNGRLEFDIYDILAPKMANLKTRLPK